MTALVIGIVLCAVALALVGMLVLTPKAALPGAGEVRTRTVEAADRAFKAQGWYGRLTERLELGGIRTSAASVVTTVILLCGSGILVGSLVALWRGVAVAWVLPLALVVLVLIASNAVVSHYVTKRRQKFGDQLDDTLQLVASGLRAGHSLPAALDAVSLESEAPTSEEFARVLNKHRIGMGLDQALEECADRMKSDDLAWTASAVAIHREVGGNLGEVLDHVGETIRERNQIRRQVDTLSAEGRLSANILIALPVLISIVLMFVSPNYLKLFVSSPIGWGLIGACLVLFTIGVLWLRVMVRIRF
jgi:tight adherence protein B